MSTAQPEQVILRIVCPHCGKILQKNLRSGKHGPRITSQAAGLLLAIDHMAEPPDGDGCDNPLSGLRAFNRGLEK